ncbi:PCC domain-containing protein [Humidisolicoccus flavus]|uniref:PCC domain-containing protein n=1 Tax=Humidisolicoccus flavus TaxID=3111414 RepID=UPI0032506CAD
MQTLTHPGLATEPRIRSVSVHSQGMLRRLTPGTLLPEELTALARELGEGNGYFEIHGGTFEPVSYCTPGPATSERAMSFSSERGDELVHLIYGSGTIGFRDGAPYVHSHCLWIDPSGKLRGGHLWPETRVGTDAPTVALYGVTGATWISADDEETNMPVFTAYKEEGDMSTNASIETTIARVLPGEDISLTIERVAKEAGYERAVVRGGLGSLVGGQLLDPRTGQVKSVDGPGTEVVALIGHVETTEEGHRTRLSCTMVDLHGELHAGELVRGENAVAVTFELILQNLSETTH